MWGAITLQGPHQVAICIKEGENVSVGFLVMVLWVMWLGLGREKEWGGCGLEVIVELL